jgi:hypothetical protein
MSDQWVLFLFGLAASGLWVPGFKNGKFPKPFGLASRGAEPFMVWFSAAVHVLLSFGMIVAAIMSWAGLSLPE